MLSNEEMRGVHQGAPQQVISYIKTHGTASLICNSSLSTTSSSRAATVPKGTRPLRINCVQQWLHSVNAYSILNSKYCVLLQNVNSFPSRFFYFLFHIKKFLDMLLFHQTNWTKVFLHCYFCYNTIEA